MLKGKNRSSTLRRAQMLDEIVCTEKMNCQVMHEKDIEQWKKFHTPKAIRLLGKMRNEMHQELKEAVRVFSLQVISDSEMQNQLDSYRGIEYLADSVNREISYANEISREEQSLYLRLGELSNSLSDINDKAYQSLLSLNVQEWNDQSVCLLRLFCENHASFIEVLGDIMKLAQRVLPDHSPLQELKEKQNAFMFSYRKMTDYAIQLGIDKTDKDYNKVELTPSYFLIVCYLNDCWIDTAKWLKSVMRIQICIQKAINESLKTIAEKMKDAQKTFVS